eukprot:COSAG03_NODE_19086_length_343_cov_0.536885_1_plen_35_part_10
MINTANTRVNFAVRAGSRAAEQAGSPSAAMEILMP